MKEKKTGGVFEDKKEMFKGKDGQYYSSHAELLEADRRYDAPTFKGKDGQYYSSSEAQIEADRKYMELMNSKKEKGNI